MYLKYVGYISEEKLPSLFLKTFSLVGIILVHDLTNKKSHQNLRKWLCEALNKGCSKDTPE